MHRLFGVFFALGHDADEVADHDDGTDAGDVRNRAFVDGGECVADELAGVDSGVRGAHDAAVQHAGQALVVDEYLGAGGFGGDVDARRGGADDAVLVDGLGWRLGVEG